MGLQDPVGLDGLHYLFQRQGAVEAIPGSGVSVPLQIEAATADRTHPTSTDERRLV